MKYFTLKIIIICLIATTLMPTVAMAGVTSTVGEGFDTIQDWFRGRAPEREASLVEQDAFSAQDEAFRAAAGFKDVPENILSKTVANFLRRIVGFVGVIFVALTVYGGIMWMTSSGNEEKIVKAKKIIVAGLIGLIITLSAYAITYLVIRTIFRPTVDFSF